MCLTGGSVVSGGFVVSLVGGSVEVVFSVVVFGCFFLKIRQGPSAFKIKKKGGNEIFLVIQ